MQFDNIEIKWLGHSGFFIKNLENSFVIYIDPYNIKSGLEKADLILITHSHYDHCSFEDMKKIAKDGTKIIATADCKSKIARFDVPIKMQIIEVGQDLSVGDIKISAVPAYNIDKSWPTSIICILIGTSNLAILL